MMRKILVIIAVITPFLTSCGSRSLDDYVPIIEDTIRGELAAANLIYEDSDLDKGLSVIGSLLDHFGYSQLAELTDYLKSDDLGDELFRLHQDGGLSYHDALSRIADDDSSPYAESALQMLDVYEDLDVSIGDVSLLKNTSSTKQWQILEANSKVVFFFALTDLDTSSPTWQCFADEETLKRYVSTLRPAELY